MPRGALAPLVRVWLVCQLFAGFGAPLVVWVSSQHLEAAECQCAHGPAATCPMHKTPKGRSDCALRSATPDGASALLLFLGPIDLAPSSASMHLTPVSLSLEPDVSVALDRPFDPDPPPPRA